MWHFVDLGRWVLSQSKVQPSRQLKPRATLEEPNQEEPAQLGHPVGYKDRKSGGCIRLKGWLQKAQKFVELRLLASLWCKKTWLPKWSREKLLPCLAIQHKHHTIYSQPHYAVRKFVIVEPPKMKILCAKRNNTNRINSWYSQDFVIPEQCIYNSFLNYKSQRERLKDNYYRTVHVEQIIMRYKGHTWASRSWHATGSYPRW